MVYDLYNTEFWKVDENDLKTIVEWSKHIANKSAWDGYTIISYYEYELYDFLEGCTREFYHNKELEESFKKGIYTTWLVVDYILRSLNNNEYNDDPIVTKESHDKNMTALINFLTTEYKILLKTKFCSDEETAIDFIKFKIKDMVRHTIFKITMSSEEILGSRLTDFLTDYGIEMLTMEFLVNTFIKD